MPTQKYSLEKNKPKRLEISWPLPTSFDNLTIRLDGQAIATIPEQMELVEGKDILLSDGSILNIRIPSDQILKRTRALHLLYNGSPIPGSTADPETNLRGLYSLLFLTGGFSLGAGVIVFGIIAVAQTASFVPGVAIGLMVMGIVLLTLGFLIRRRSLAALIVAIILFITCGIAIFVTAPGYLILAALPMYFAYYLGMGIKWLKS